MSDRLSGTDDRYQHQAGEGYFARLASARYMLLTTIELDGTFVSTPVHGVVDGDRAYFRIWSRSGIVKRLEHAGAVQLMPCSVLGLCSYPPPLDVAVRSLPAEEARRVAGKLARKYPVQHRFLIRLLQRTCRWQMAYYELLALDAADNHDVGLGPSGVPDGQPDQCTGAWVIAEAPKPTRVRRRT
jgi:PPOX class probable F420-dependent enzyme